MYGFENRPQEIETSAPAAFLDPAVLTRSQIDALIMRGDRLRAEAMHRFGRQVASTIASIFRRPGRLTVAPAEPVL